MGIDLILTVGAFFCFGVAAFPSLIQSPRLNLVALGLALLTLTLVL